LISADVVGGAGVAVAVIIVIINAVGVAAASECWCKSGIIDTIR